MKLAKGSVSEPARSDGESRMVGEVGIVELKSQEAIESSPLAEGLRPIRLRSVLEKTQ